MCSTVGSFPLIYNNKKAILELDRKVIDLAPVKYHLGNLATVGRARQSNSCDVRVGVWEHTQVRGQGGDLDAG